MKKIGLIIMVVVLALGALGAGYAAWSQTLTINGAVAMGNLAAQFDQDSLTAIYSDDDAAAAPDDGTGAITYDTQDANGNDEATITITNAYPGYAGTAVLTVINTGTIPIDVAIVEDTDTGDIFSEVGGITSLAVGATTDFTISIAIPTDDTTWGNDSMDGTFTATYVITATQYNIP